MEYIAPSRHETAFSASGWRDFLRTLQKGLLSGPVLVFLGVLVLTGQWIWVAKSTALPVAEPQQSAVPFVPNTGVEAAPAPTQEMHIANNGLVYVQGAQIVGISDSAIIAKSSWEAEQFTWTITTDRQTKFFLNNGETSSINSIKVGDYVSVTGLLNGGNSGIGIKASSIRDSSRNGNTVVTLKDF